MRRGRHRGASGGGQKNLLMLPMTSNMYLICDFGNSCSSNSSLLIGIYRNASGLLDLRRILMVRILSNQ